jgi:hypothetical protein
MREVRCFVFHACNPCSSQQQVVQAQWTCSPRGELCCLRPQCAYYLHSEHPDCRKMSREVMCQLSLPKQALGVSLSELCKGTATSRKLPQYRVQSYPPSAAHDFLISNIKVMLLLTGIPTRRTKSRLDLYRQVDAV